MLPRVAKQSKARHTFQFWRENVSQSAQIGKYPPVSGINLTRADNEGARLGLILTPGSPLLSTNTNITHHGKLYVGLLVCANEIFECQFS